MSEPVKRQYRSPLREQAARRTRAQIRDAAARLFVRQGYAATTMRQIAEEAEVSERTTYLAFPSKLDLFIEAIRVAMAAAIWWITTLQERAGPLLMAAYESAGADQALRKAAMEGERARARDLALIARALHSHGTLRPDLGVEEATDILLAWISPQTHQILRRDRRRSLARYQNTLLTVLERALLRE